VAGHSHWAKVKRAKAATDAKRGKVWSKLARRVIVAAKQGGGNPDDNLQLRYAIEDARAANMPNDTISRAIKKGTGRLAAESFEQVVYEGYGPAGVAFIVDCLTDNRNRTAPEIRKLFERYGGQLSASGCVAWMFEKKGSFVISAEKADEDSLVEIALEAGGDDVRVEGDLFEITCRAGAFGAVKQALADRGIETESGEIALVPNNSVTVEGDKARSVLSLMEALEDHDDVQNVYANFDVPDKVMAEIEKVG
jgi:YebC/PmpR family DNA-binding regulatory protein